MIAFSIQVYLSIGRLIHNKELNYKIYLLIT